MAKRSPLSSHPRPSRAILSIIWAAPSSRTGGATYLAAAFTASGALGMATPVATRAAQQALKRVLAEPDRPGDGGSAR